MKEQEKKLNLITFLIIAGGIIGFCIFLIKVLIFKLEAEPVFSTLVPFTDFKDTMLASDSPYSIIGGGRNYFPMTYMIMRVLNIISFKNIQVAYILSFAIFIISFIWFYSYIFKDKIKNRFVYIIILVFFTYPMLFLFERANVEYFVLMALILFIVQFKKEKYFWAALSLAIAVGMKLYPALFALLFLKRKQYKSFFACAIISIGVFIIGYFIMGGRIDTIGYTLQNFDVFTKLYSKGIFGLQYNHSILFGLNYFFYYILTGGQVAFSDMNILYTGYTIIVPIIACFICAYIVFIEKKEWKCITLITLMITAFPHTSFDYTLIHMAIPMAFFITSLTTKKWESLFYAISFALLQIPMNWLEETHKIYKVTTNLGLIIRPSIIIAIMLVIIITGITDKKKKIFIEEKI